MAIYAKLFTRGDEQVLVTKEDDDETGGPVLKTTVDIGWAKATPALFFKDTKAGRKSRDQAFDEMTEERAFATRDRMVESFGDVA